LEFYPANGTIGDYKIIKVPGHSAGSVIIEYKGVCFVGDLLMVKNNEFIPVDEDYNENQTTYIKTLQKANLGKTQFIFPGHGKPIPTQPA
jgi:glyoxylase-like metal-dependent hydrolase (beta-lactamase superfamily II)